MRKDLRDQERMMGAEVPCQGLAKLGALGRIRPRASSAMPAGSIVPPTSASSMARPEVSRMSVATVASLMPASSSNLWTRLASRVRSWIRDLR